MIELDGGSGQAVRIAAALSVITQKPFRFVNIRANRSEPGLKAQHVACIKACAQFGNAYVGGNTVGSTELEFVPREIKSRQLKIQIGTAGSIGLLLQAVLPIMLFTESELSIEGGTDVAWSMPVDYVAHVVRPVLQQYAQIDLSCERRGYYPAGQGFIIIKTKPRFKRVQFDTFKEFHQFIFGDPAIRLDTPGELMLIKGISHASHLLQHARVAERQAQTAEMAFRAFATTRVEREYSTTQSPGSGIMLYALFGTGNNHKDSQYRIGSDQLGKQGLKAEAVAEQAAERLKKRLAQQICVDEHLQDTIIPYLGLFGGRILTGSITPHTEAAMDVCEAFLEVTYTRQSADTSSRKNHLNQQDYNEANLISVLSSSKA